MSRQCDDSEEIAFWHEVLQNPCDMAPRLVYADWLEDHAEPQAEFIRLQILLAGASPLSRHQRSAAEARARELQSRHQRHWNRIAHRKLRETPFALRVDSRTGMIRGWDYRRGFPEIVHMPAEAFFEHYFWLGTVFPVRRVVLHAVHGWVERILSARAEAIRDLDAVVFPDDPQLWNSRFVSRFQPGRGARENILQSGRVLVGLANPRLPTLVTAGR